MSSPELLSPTFHLRPKHHHQHPCTFLLSRSTSKLGTHSKNRIFLTTQKKPITLSSVAKAVTGQANGVYIVGDFMTKREELHVVKPTTTVDQALVMLVENRITGFPVIDDDWKLVGLVSDYDLLALDSVSGTGRTDADMFPVVDSTWKTFNEVQKLLSKTNEQVVDDLMTPAPTFNEVQKLLSKTNGQVVGDLMTPAPVVVQESTNLEDAARVLLETKYRRLPVVDSDGKLVGIITRGNVVRAALQIKRATEATS